MRMLSRKTKLMLKNIKLSDQIRKIPVSLVLGLIVLFAVIRLSYLFSLRDGHHVDETWSYGFANSYYTPQIYGGERLEEWQNIGEWVPGTVFKDYLSVSEDERFSFDSVVNNEKYDLSPPLYALGLHFVSSLFPNSFSWIFAFIISVFAFVPSLVFLYLVSYEFTNSRFCGYLAVCYYIFSGCGTANFLYLRVYHLVTLFTLALFYLVICLVKRKSFNPIIFYLPLFLITLLGALTHYYFLVMAFLITVFTIVVLFVKKRLFDAVKFGSTMLLSVIVFFLVYNRAVTVLLPFLNTSVPTTSVGTNTVTGYYSYPYLWDLAVANLHFFVSSIGFYIDFSIPGLIEFFGIVVFGAAIIALFMFLFRNEKWYKSLRTKVFEQIRKIIGFVVSVIKAMDVSACIALLSVVLYLFIIPYSATLYSMGYTERYFFAAMTLFITVWISAWGLIIKKISLTLKINRIFRIVLLCGVSLLLIVLCIFSNSQTERFKFSYMKEEALRSELAGKDVYVYATDTRDLVWLSAVLVDSKNVFVELPELITEDHHFPQVSDDCVLLIVNCDFMTEEQKEEYDLTGDYSYDSNNIPTVKMTFNEFVDQYRSETGSRAEFVDEFNTFIGYVELFE